MKAEDVGVAVYFTLGGKPHALACDRWTRVEDNCHALELHVEALRGQERWGVGSVAQAFAGYAQLPAHGPRPWREVLGVCLDTAEVEERFARLALKAHPDRGGTAEAMSELLAARAAARAELGGAR